MKLQRPDPGIDAAKSGLHGKAGIFFNAGLLSKGGGFNPLDLDPYLLFDARTSMIGTLENPTLDLDPSKQDTLDVITATRAGTATFTDINGLIASAPANTVRVDQTQGAELTPTKFQRVPYSTPDSNWAKTNSTLVENFDAAPDGTQSASKVTKLAVSGIGSSNDRVKYPSIAIINGTTYSVSVHLKNIDVAGFTTISARVSGGSLFRCKFIWSISSLTSDGGTTSNRLVEDVGNGWYRVSFSFESNGASASFEIDIDRSTGGREDTSSILVWGAQLEEGTTASDFVANTTGSPKFITGPTFGPRVPMILVEPSATNLLPYSEDLGQWNESINGSGVSPVLTSDQEIAPNGLQEADKIVFNLGGGTSTGDLTSLFISPSLSGQPYAGSIYLKGENGGEVILFRTVTGGYTELTLTTDWQRFESIETYVSGTRRFEIGLRGGIVSGGINNTATIYAWGAQLETGSVATSYIPTSGSTAQRAADDLVISGSDFDFYNQSEGTVYGEMVRNVDPYDSYPVIFHAGASSDYIRLSTSGQYRVRVSDVNQTNNTIGTFATGSVSRFAFSYKQNDFVGTIDGSSESTDTSGLLPSVNQLTIGSFLNTANYLQGHIRRLIYWPVSSDSL